MTARAGRAAPGLTIVPAVAPVVAAAGAGGGDGGRRRPRRRGFASVLGRGATRAHRSLGLWRDDPEVDSLLAVLEGDGVDPAAPPEPAAAVDADGSGDGDASLDVLGPLRLGQRLAVARSCSDVSGDPRGLGFDDDLVRVTAWPRARASAG